MRAEVEDIGFDEALSLTLARLEPRSPSPRPVWKSSGFVLAEEVRAKVDSPSLSASARDGFAIRARDSAGASPSSPRELLLIGDAVAGGRAGPALEAGTAVAVTTGAPLPAKADAVIPHELARREGVRLRLLDETSPGRNVLAQGCDVARGQPLAFAGTMLRPAMAGLLAAGGVSDVLVYRRPAVALVATGDEVVSPGAPLAPGQLYASNLVTLSAWLAHFGLEATAKVAPDDSTALRGVLEEALVTHDVVLTSGGAWTSHRDIATSTLAEMGFELVYHRVRLAPGKAVALALRGEKVAFCLPGGPPSNEMAFLQLALPGLLSLCGSPRAKSPFPTVTATLTEPVRKQQRDPSWTNFFQARLAREGDQLLAEPLRPPSRLQAQAQAEALIVLPPGRIEAGKGELVSVQVLFAGEESVRSG